MGAIVVTLDVAALILEAVCLDIEVSDGEKAIPGPKMMLKVLRNLPTVEMRSSVVKVLGRTTRANQHRRKPPDVLRSLTALAHHALVAKLLCFDTTLTGT